jgi:hypothetical protein
MEKVWMDGKEGVSGSGPEEGSLQSPNRGLPSFGCTCTMNDVR